MSEPVELPPMPAPAEQSWLGLLDVADAVPDHWALVGGQLVHLHCWERGVPPLRVTRDSDIVLDVRAWPQAAEEFTSTLRGLGFVPTGTTWNNRQYRWVRDQAQIDVLIARLLGERAQNRVGVGGGTLLPTPGATSALARVQAVRVHLGNRSSTIRRPSLLGSLIIKATAYVEVLDDPQRDRHLSDFAVLASMVSRSDLAAMVLTRHENRRMTSAIASLRGQRPLVAAVPGVQEGLERLVLAMGNDRPPTR